MSIPRKHHYVPQVHIRKFKTDDGYNVFRKTDSKTINFKSSSQFFVVKDLNSSIDFETKEIDHKTTESEITKLWDDKFNNHFDILCDWIQSLVNAPQVSEDNIQDTLKFFFEYSIVGYFRRLKQTNEFQENGFEWVNEFVEVFEELENEELDGINLSKENIEEGILGLKDFITELVNESKHFDKLKYPVPSVTEAKMLIPEKLSCDIFLTRDSSFNLPDCTSMIITSNDKFDYQKYQLNKVAYIGLPLTPNVFIRLKNNEVLVEDSDSKVYLIDEIEVKKINKLLFDYAIDQILITNQ